MGATVPILRQARAVAGAVSRSVSEIDDAARKTEEADKSWVAQVYLPLALGSAWHGAGQPQALVVVYTNGTAISTARVRIRQAHDALGGLQDAMLTAADWWDDLSRTLDPAKYDVQPDGTVTKRIGAEFDPGDPSPHLLTTQVQKVLRYVDAQDSACARRLRQVNTDELPVSTTRATPGIRARAHEAYEEATQDLPDGPRRPWDSNWTLKGNFHAMTAIAWANAIGVARCKPGRLYSGGGFITGPDGRRYPIGVPLAFRHHDSYTHGDGVDSRGGRDVGWQTLDVRTGFAQLEEPAGTGTKELVELGALAGGKVSPQVGVDVSRTKGLVFDEQGYPLRAGDPGPSKGSVEPGGAPSEPARVAVRDQTGRAHIRTYQAPQSKGPGGLALGINALEGADAITHLDDGTYYTYRTEFQENIDGRTRVELTTYQVTVANGGQDVAVQPYDAHVDENGDLVMERAKWYDEPEHGTTIGPSHEIRVNGG